MGINPYDIPHLRRASEKGLGSLDDVDVLGEKIVDVAKAFKRD
jgi:hypothetical protein